MISITIYVARNLTFLWYKWPMSHKKRKRTFGHVRPEKTNEPLHDKSKTIDVRPAKIQIRPGFHHVWSESSVCAHLVAKDLSFLLADSEDSD